MTTFHIIGDKIRISYNSAAIDNNHFFIGYTYPFITIIIRRLGHNGKVISGNCKINDTIKEQLSKLEQAGYSKFPICIAKTQYSFSVDPKLKGAPTDHKLEVREIRLSSGAEFIVVVCGSIMTMPGLPRAPAADKIKLNTNGDVEGLF